MRDSLRVARLAIHDMLDRIADIRSAVDKLTFVQFVDSKLHRSAVERMIEIVSEASRRIPEEIKTTEPSIPWSKVAGIGNILRHDYEDVAPQAIWNVVQKDLEPLERALQRMLAAMVKES